MDNSSTCQLENCPFCGRETPLADLAQALWLPPGAVALLESRHPGWRLAHGACPKCVHESMIQILVEQGAVPHVERRQAAGPFPPETAFGILPTPLRLHASPRYKGRGVTIAMLDSAFYPHPDLTRPHNRIRAWVDASADPVKVLYFGRDDTPQWPGWDSADPSQWHGMMTTAVAAGNGYLSHGLYRGLASEADLVLVQVRGTDGFISNESITRGLQWLLEHGTAGKGDLDVRVANLSVGGGPTRFLASNPVDRTIAALVRQGITVVAAAGNEGVRRLVPPATAREAITVGGVDDKNNFNESEADMWHSNYGSSAIGIPKPELVAPSIWVVAPVLPISGVAEEARNLFAARPEGNLEVEFRIAQLKMVTPHYQHVDGTSFAAPIVAGTIACMLEANPGLTPERVREIVLGTAEPLPGVEREKQGAGVLVPRRAIGMALREPGGAMEGVPLSPVVASSGVTFWLHEPNAKEVNVFGSWNGWREPGLAAEQVLPAVWEAHLPPIEPGEYTYRFLLDASSWTDDPDNPRRALNTFGNFDSLLTVPGPEAAQEG